MSPGASMEWKLTAFDALSVAGLYALLQLRSAVFVLEQNCVFQDMDGADAQAMHLMGWRDGQLLAYARCFPAGIKFTEASIGRVVTSKRVRGSGLGHLLIEQALAAVATHWGRQAVRIGAQARLKSFYTGHGFADAGIAYVEDGIEHLEMIWQP